MIFFFSNSSSTQMFYFLFFIDIKKEPQSKISLHVRPTSKLPDVIWLFLPHSLIPWTPVHEDAVQTWGYEAPTQGKQVGHSGASSATHALTHQKPLCRESGVF